jgi:hypothetical protein
MPDGETNATVTQYLGRQDRSITQSKVHNPRGGETGAEKLRHVVPYGPRNARLRDCTECPWRAGANENTTFSVSNDG